MKDKIGVIRDGTSPHTVIAILVCIDYFIFKRKEDIFFYMSLWN